MLKNTQIHRSRHWGAHEKSMGFGIRGLDLKHDTVDLRPLTLSINTHPISGGYMSIQQSAWSLGTFWLILVPPLLKKMTSPRSDLP